ncbi:MAG: DNA-directed RNA polymerase subunit beta [Deltaproteobacteria bacterium]|nr:DNA-directed RNA polymerase subunit beta [Deltaproteobacteria bacterium]
MIRKRFGRIKSVLEIPNLLEIQRRSFDKFLQKDIPAEMRKPYGLQGAFKSVFPIKDFSGKASLEFVSYRLLDPRYDEQECLEKSLTYSAPLKIIVRLVVFDGDRNTENRLIRDIKEQEVFFGDVPLMTEKGTFIINGTERVIVSQLHRSPGIFFDSDKGKTLSSGKVVFFARIIPIRGSWLDFEFDSKDLLYVRIDKRRKMPVTILLKAIGFSTAEIIEKFYKVAQIRVTPDGYEVAVDDNLVGSRADADIRKGEEIIVRKGKKITANHVKRILGAGVTAIRLIPEELAGKILAVEIRDASQQEVIFRPNEVISAEMLDEIRNLKVEYFHVASADEEMVSPSIHQTLNADKTEGVDEALMEIYRRLRPSNPPTPEAAQKFFHSLFFEPEMYDLSDVGRAKMNYKLRLDTPTDVTTLRREDIMAAVKYLVDLKIGVPDKTVDDIDHLGNRRVRSVGELIENQYRIGLVRMERSIREKMSLQDVETMAPPDFINSKPVTAVISEFFGSSQLSQFMDQTNPLSEVTHKRRLSALGPGGLTRERAGFEVRDVHPTHYGRICPIETPEGPNIGLIVSLSTYARVNEFGFIETPYMMVKEGKITGEIRYLTAIEEEEKIFAPADTPFDEKGDLLGELVSCRRGEDFIMVPPEEVAMMDVSPNQLISVAAAIIPFLEHDDANRALMGSNMQRQAVPLVIPKAPLVGTGMEAVVGRDSGVVVTAKRSGIVTSVNSKQIVIKTEIDRNSLTDVGFDTYRLVKYKRSNQDTCFNQKPIVFVGDVIKEGDVIADGPATEMGDLALGRNVMVAFMSWGGYNYEDSILVSERIVQDDVYTSIHIEKFEAVARDTKIGPEEITRDIPNIGDEALRNLDENGIVRMGVFVKPGDILVGKITPKSETQLSAEEKLLRAIFGEKASDVRDSSLRVPPGVEGIVVDAKIFVRKRLDRDSKAQKFEDEQIHDLGLAREEEIALINRAVREEVITLLSGKKSGAKLLDAKKKKELLDVGEVITAEFLEKVSLKVLKGITLKGDEKTESKVRLFVDNWERRIAEIEKFFAQKMEKIRAGDELAPGILKVVTVYVAIKRKLAVGDKMAGRHGNKGVLSRILPKEDMPFFYDGTPVDIVLNPLGVPSRMNVGQILETHLGWAAKGLGDQINALMEKKEPVSVLRNKLKEIYTAEELESYLEGRNDDEGVLRIARTLSTNGVAMATPVFDGAPEGEIKKLLLQAGLPVSGQSILFDGRTGEPFDQKITVGMIYMLKLHHLVDNKIHARSIGPYSLITQQPLGGKAQFGGQRLGEMEVWALEAYGAAYTLQEFLTVKSDDVAGRTRTYEAIVKGEHTLEAGIPESFNVLVKEMQGLGLDVSLIEEEEHAPHKD